MGSGGDFGSFFKKYGLLTKWLRLEPQPEYPQNIATIIDCPIQEVERSVFQEMYLQSMPVESVSVVFDQWVVIDRARVSSLLEDFDKADEASVLSTIKAMDAQIDVPALRALRQLETLNPKPECISR